MCVFSTLVRSNPKRVQKRRLKKEENIKQRRDVYTARSILKNYQILNMIYRSTYFSYLDTY